MNGRFYTFDERRTIEKSIKEGKTFREISHILNRPPLSVKFEITKHGGTQNYNALEAHEQTKKNRTHSVAYAPREFTEEERILAKEMIDQGFSFTKIKKQLKISYYSLVRNLKNSNITLPNSITADRIKSTEERLDSLEMQLDIILDNLKDLNEKVINRR